MDSISHSMPVFDVQCTGNLISIHLYYTMTIMGSHRIIILKKIKFFIINRSTVKAKTLELIKVVKVPGY